MVRTRVGYTGGTTRSPTYRSIGDHAETIEIDFDPKQTCYAELLDVFWQSHNPCSRPWSRQYMSAIFYHDEAQKRIAEKTMHQTAKTRGADVHTLIEKASTFYLAEDYHQKYRLRQQHATTAEYLAVYPELRGFVDSTAVTRVNGYLGGHGTLADFERDLPHLGLSLGPTTQLRALVQGRLAR